jgi:hypothetical protein
MADADNCRSAFAPHFGHFFTGEAEKGSIFSKRWPHLTHSYSYNGNADSSQKMVTKREYSMACPQPKSKKGAW